ncbi:SdiA-regulated domain-containing protein [Spirosoma rhododendri]|uniref:Uncharacterized protein n=1 Tax=Spirosoma rhododendri TaxID=2728024 RepID=A0A7L5DP18_9BACT|nr:SdiA-regulated domain-containing protein [Spirosoma rhododendri]QJD80199.1 hypothetical protein HH216_18595 [Spirosoma rhododendri]
MRVLALALLLMGCGSSSTTKQSSEAESKAPAYPFAYRLNQPASVVNLPKKLDEISGLSYYKPNQLLCIQDEAAAVYVYDIQAGKVIEDIDFGGYGDFEGVEYVKGEVYALESNGMLSRFKPGDLKGGHVKTGVPAKTEVEGLGYDPKSNQLLIAVKKGSTGASDKAIYTYDLTRKTVYKALNISDVQLEEAGIDPDSYKPSGIAVHPITGDWYVLTSAGHRLVVMNRQGKILYSEKLDEKLLRQPEGICFAPSGDLFIASEGKGKKAVILTFPYQK